MIARILMFAVAACLSLPAPQQAKQSPEKKFEPETFYMALMRSAAPAEGEKMAELPAEEAHYWQAIADKGDLVASGPVENSKDNLQAVMIFRAPDLGSAKDVAQEDPVVKSGMWSVEVHPWITQKGVLRTIKDYHPSASFFIGFLRRGTKFTDEDSPERQKIQEEHMANIRRLADLGKLVAAGPFTDDGDLRGIFVFNTETAQEANELTNTDPAVRAGRLRIDLYHWTVPANPFVPLK